jgi:predicted DNA-binding transcriptional regulator AlpA
MSLESNRAKRNPPLPTDLNSDKLISPAQAAELMNISLATLQRRWREGEGPRRIRISARRLGVKLRDLRDYLDARTV